MDNEFNELYYDGTNEMVFLRLFITGGGSSTHKSSTLVDCHIN